MNRSLCLAVTMLSALSLFGCERRDGKIIIDEQKAEQKLDHAAEKTADGAKKLGNELDKAGKNLGQKIDEKVDDWDRKHDENAPKGQGGGPAAKDAGHD